MYLIYPLLQLLIMAIPVAAVAAVVIAVVMPRYRELSHWHHTFDNEQFPIREFYLTAEACMAEQ